MKKIGLVTLWKRNYGSALQCYATKSMVEKMGYHCIPLYRTFPGIQRYTYYLGEIVRFAIDSFRYKGYISKYTSLRSAGKKSIGSLSKKSEESIDRFVDDTLQPEGYSYSQLKNIGKSEDFIAFIAGSDQIWNGSRRYDLVSFLGFVSDKKKIALAPSFGSEIEDYNKRSFSKEIRKFQLLSAREQEGVDNIAELTGRDAIRLSDPTSFLTPDEWRDFSKAADDLEGEYIFIHFLDKPCDFALQAMEKLRSDRGLPMVAFAYPQEEYERIKGIRFCNGGPRDYVKYIDRASYVMTDSFHTTLFSIYFNTSFFTFHRQYTHNAKQTSRISNLLTLYGCEERFVADMAAFIEILDSDLPDSFEIRDKERQKLIGYLKKALDD